MQQPAPQQAAYAAWLRCQNMTYPTDFVVVLHPDMYSEEKTDM